MPSYHPEWGGPPLSSPFVFLLRNLLVRSKRVLRTIGCMGRDTAPVLHRQRADASGFYVKELFVNHILKSKSGSVLP